MRRMSFAMTTKQARKRIKTVTRRLGWWFLKPGDVIMACEKCMGLKKGEHPVDIGRARVVSANAVPLSAIDAEDCSREGLSWMTPGEFISFFCRVHKAKNCTPDTLVNRIVLEWIDP